VYRRGRCADAASGLGFGEDATVARDQQGQRLGSPTSTPIATSIIAAARPAPSTREEPGLDPVGRPGLDERGDRHEHLDLEVIGDLGLIAVGLEL